MKMIKMLSEDIRGNIHEAEEKIKTAYKLREKDKSLADWYRDMAVAHLGFNTTGHSLVARMIHEAEAEMHDNPMLPGMKAVYNEMHADIMAEAAEVQGMIAAYK